MIFMNNRFDCIVNKEIFKCEDKDVFEWYFKMLYFETTKNEPIENDSIMIITDREPFELRNELVNMFRTSKYYRFKQCNLLGHGNVCIYCDNLGSKANELRIIIVSTRLNENMRCWRNKAIILDINYKETEIQNEYLDKCLFPTLIYYDENKLSHGRIVFYKNKNILK